MIETTYKCPECGAENTSKIEEAFGTFSKVMRSCDKCSEPFVIQHSVKASTATYRIEKEEAK